VPLFRAAALALLVAAAPLCPAEAPAADSEPAPRAPAAVMPAMHPMASDMLDRMLRAGRAEADPVRRRAVLDNAAQGIPRAFYGLILDGVPAPAPGSIENEVAHAVFLRWAWITPDYAAAWAAASPPGPFRNEALAEAAGRWAGKNPADAVRWTRSLAPGDRRWVFENAVAFMSRASPASIDAWRQAARSDS
jgi:hypothetical protein